MRLLVFLTVLCSVALLNACAQGTPTPSRQNAPRVYPRSYANTLPNTQAPVPRQLRSVTPRSYTSLTPARPLPKNTEPPPAPDCAAVCVIDPRTGNILYSHNADVRRQVASTQKIVTALCVCDAGNLDKMVTIQSSDNLAPPIRLNLKPGTRYRKLDLLRAMLTGSFNDVAVCLARDTAGSVDAFVNRMNARARKMRMYDTHFANPNGLPANQYSTAHDMALAACYAYNNRIIRGFINVPEYDFVKSDGSVRRIRSTNKLLSRYSWVQGMKTGYTNAAGKCLISCGSHNGSAVIVVVLGSTGRKIWGESLKYLKWALQMG